MRKRQLANEPVQSIQPHTGRLICCQSCGCAEPKDASAHDLYYSDSTDMLEKYLDPYPVSHIMTAETLDSFASALQDNVYLFGAEKPEVACFALCLCDDWNQSEPFRRDGYSDQLLCFNSVDKRTWFHKKDLLPPHLLRRTGFSVTYLSAVHFQAHCFGYALLTFFSPVHIYSLHYPRFCMDMSNGLELICVRERMKSYAYQSYLSEVRDSLTGVYRLAALAGLFAEHREQQTETQQLVLVGVSVLSLQKIAEIYGQLRGDRLILHTAQILISCCRNGESCVRSATNEFVIIGNPDKGTDTLLCNDIRMQLEQHLAPAMQLRIESCIASVAAADGETADSCLARLRKCLKQMEETAREKPGEKYTAAFFSLRKEIYDHPDSAWTLEICAKRVSLSLSQFQRLYRKLFDISCKADVRNSKLTHAKRLLVETELTLQDIATQCGYDYAHFMRLFHQSTGLTPAEYRKEHGT